MTEAKTELTALLDHKRDDEYTTLTIFIVAIMVCVGAFGIMTFNIAAAFSRDSYSTCSEYARTQKVTSAVVAGLAVLGAILLILAYFRAERKLGKIRALFIENEIPVWA